MPSILFNLDALAHNARQTARLAEKWKVEILPVLKAVAAHPAAQNVLAQAGFPRLGCAEENEPDIFKGPRGELTLIQLSPPSRARAVAEKFKRSFQAVPETLLALNQAARELGRTHEVMLMADLGDHREGLNPDEFPEVLDLALSLPHLEVAGFGSTIACLGERPPDEALAGKLNRLKEMFLARGLNPVVSLGGSVFCDWVDRRGAEPITELRLGDPFILGEDIYRLGPLPGGPFRRDVCRLQAEVVEIRQRVIPPPDGEPTLHQADGQEKPAVHFSGPRLRALLSLGRFHTSLGTVDRHGAPILSRMSCQWPGAVIVGLSAGYLVLDVTDCPRPVEVGQPVVFHPGYWSIAQAFRNPTVEVRLTRD